MRACQAVNRPCHNPLRMTSSGVAMRFEQELHHGLRVIIEIEQQPGTHNALTVSADVSLSGQFLTQRLEQYQGGNRIFASRLVEGIDLLEEVSGDIVRRSGVHASDTCLITYTG